MCSKPLVEPSKTKEMLTLPPQTTSGLIYDICD